MPHVVIEYSDNISSAMQTEDICQVAHNTMIQSGLFLTGDIKTRAYSAQDFLVGEKGKDGSFVHITVYIMEGRSILQKQILSEALCNAVHGRLQTVDQVSVDVRELVKDIYRKRLAS